MRKSICALLVFLSLGTATTVKAEELSESSQETNNSSVKRFGIEGGLGLNVFFPFAQITVNYRLPVMDNRWDAFISQSANVAIAPLIHITSLGAKYYFDNNEPNPKLLTLQPFFAGSIGGAYSISSIRGTQDKSISFSGVVICIGIGTDLHIIDNLQLSGALYASYPLIARPEVNLKVRF